MELRSPVRGVCVCVGGGEALSAVRLLELQIPPPPLSYPDWVLRLTFGLVTPHLRIWESPGSDCSENNRTTRAEGFRREVGGGERERQTERERDQQG